MSCGYATYAVSLIFTPAAALMSRAERRRPPPPRCCRFRHYASCFASPFAAAADAAILMPPIFRHYALPPITPAPLFRRHAFFIFAISIAAAAFFASDAAMRAAASSV